MKQKETEILIKMNHAIGELSGKVDGINQRLDGINGSLKTHDEAINELQTFKDNLTGKLGVIGTIAGFLGSIITMIVNYLIKEH